MFTKNVLGKRVLQSTTYHCHCATITFVRGVEMHMLHAPITTRMLSSSTSLLEVQLSSRHSSM